MCAPMPSEKTLRATQKFLIAYIVTIRRLLNLLTYRDDVLSCGDELAATEARAHEKSYAPLREAMARNEMVDAAQRCREICTDMGIEWLLLSDARYPAILRTICDPPPIIFARGVSLDLVVAKPAIAIVGSRRGSSEGCAFARGCAEQLANHGNVVISGLALGIDAAAHQGAIEGGENSTVAVLGSGVDLIYPRLHERLADLLLSRGGVLLSPFPPGTPAFPSHFLERNRIITGLSLGTLIVQATERSGALNSARYALEQGREVMAIPGSLNDPRHAGTNKLLKDGAGMVLNPIDLWDYVPALVRRQVSAKISPQDTGATCGAVCDYLAQQGPTPYEQVVAALAPQTDVASEVLELELAGALVREPGNILCMNSAGAKTQNG